MKDVCCVPKRRHGGTVGHGYRQHIKKTRGRSVLGSNPRSEGHKSTSYYITLRRAGRQTQFTPLFHWNNIGSRLVATGTVICGLIRRLSSLVPITHLFWNDWSEHKEKLHQTDDRLLICVCVCQETRHPSVWCSVYDGDIGFIYMYDTDHIYNRSQ